MGLTNWDTNLGNQPKKGTDRSKPNNKGTDVGLGQGWLVRLGSEVTWNGPLKLCQRERRQR